MIYSGTFILRISGTMTSSLIISYVDSSSSTTTSKNKSNNIKHVILKRQSPYKFIVYHKHQQDDNNHLSLSHLIRGFIKLKYIYVDENKIYPKNVLF